MRYGFENQLRQFNEIAKDLSDPELPEEAKSRLNDVLDWHIKKAAERLRTPQETQRFVFEMQEKKRQIMEKLKLRLRQIDNPFQEKERDSRQVTFKDGQFICDFQGQTMPITQGEILTDVEWGVAYDLDPATVPKLLRKRYLVEVAKRDLMGLLNEQISETEERTKRPANDLGKVAAYRELRSWERDNDDSSSGQYAEREIRNFLRKLAIDMGAEYRVVQGDAHQDVEQKIDFILVLPNKARGVYVDKKTDLNEQDVGGLRLGIQFTINANKERVDKKTKQIAKSKSRLAPTDKIDDIVLIKMNLPGNLDNVRTWAKNGKPPGGPEKNWTLQKKAYAIIALLTGYLSDEKIDGLLIRSGIPTKQSAQIRHEWNSNRAASKIPITESENQPTSNKSASKRDRDKRTPSSQDRTAHDEKVLHPGDIIETAVFALQEDGTYRATNSKGRGVVLAPGQFPRTTVPYNVMMAIDKNEKNKTYGELVAYIISRKKKPKITPPSSPAP